MLLIHETKRLYLKVLDPIWAPWVCDFYKKNKDAFEAVEPARIPNFYTEKFHYSNLSQEYNEFVHGHYLRLYLFEKRDPNVIIGSICFNGFKRSCFQTCVLGYKVGGEYQNQGYITEALQYSIRNIIFNEFKMHRIEALVLPDNKASICVLEKCGFVLEGICRDYAKLDNVWRDHLRYSVLEYQ